MPSIVYCDGQLIIPGIRFYNFDDLANGNMSNIFKIAACKT